MSAPIHPGEFIRRILVAEDIGVQDFAKRLGISRVSLSKVIHGKCGITPVLALRLSRVLTLPPEQFMKFQTDYDLYRTNLLMSDELASLVPLSTR